MRGLQSEGPNQTKRMALFLGRNFESVEGCLGNICYQKDIRCGKPNLFIMSLGSKLGKDCMGLELLT